MTTLNSVIVHTLVKINGSIKLQKVEIREIIRYKTWLEKIYGINMKMILRLAYGYGMTESVASEPAKSFF